MDNQKWVICSDRFPGRRHDLLMELIASNPGTYHIFSSATLVTTLYRITGERDDVPALEAIATDWLRAFVRTGATHPQACATIRVCINEISRKPNETIAAVASRQSGASRASIVNRDFPRANEMMSFSWYIPEDKPKKMMRRLSVTGTTVASEQIGQQYMWSGSCTKQPQKSSYALSFPMIRCVSGCVTEGWPLARSSGS